jgi:hypothetical protein
MGAILDSAKNIRQDKKDSSRQAHKVEEKLEKDKDKGLNGKKRRNVKNSIGKDL